MEKQTKIIVKEIKIQKQREIAQKEIRKEILVFFNLFQESLDQGTETERDNTERD